MPLRRVHLFALAAVILAGGGFAGISSSRPLTVATVQAEVGSGVDVYGLGTVEARRLSRLGFDAAGLLTALLADQGDRVAAGTVLARLEDAQQRARLARAEADAKQAEAAVRQAEARVQRARAVLAQKSSVNRRRQTLVGGGTVSRETAEDADAEAQIAAADASVADRDLEAASAAAQSAAAQVAVEREALAKLSLAAPYDAVVVERARELGSVIAPGTPVFTVVDPASIWVRAYVDEALAGSLAVGQAAAITLRSRPNQRLAGRVVRIDIESDRVAEERIVHVAFDTIPDEFHLGEQAEVLVAVEGIGLVLPAGAIEKPGSVWIAEAGQARRRDLQAGRLFAGGKVEVLGGLAAGDRVILPVSGLSDGRAVTIEAQP